MNLGIVLQRIEGKWELYGVGVFSGRRGNVSGSDRGEIREAPANGNEGEDVYNDVRGICDV